MIVAGEPAFGQEEAAVARCHDLQRSARFTLLPQHFPKAWRACRDVHCIAQPQAPNTEARHAQHFAAQRAEAQLEQHIQVPGREAFQIVARQRLRFVARWNHGQPRNVCKRFG